MSDGPEALPTRSILKWTIGLSVFAVLVLFLASTLYLHLRLSKSSIRDVEPFDIDAFTSISVPAERNAAKLYREAAPLFVERGTGRLKQTELEAFEKSYDEAVAKNWKFANDDVRRWLKLDVLPNSSGRNLGRQVLRDSGSAGG